MSIFNPEPATILHYADTVRQPWTMESIQRWAHATFGPPTVSRAVGRACEELQELHATAPDYSLTEMADVVICLLAAPGVLQAIQDKMDVNVQRTWHLRGDGTGYHVKENPSDRPI